MKIIATLIVTFVATAAFATTRDFSNWYNYPELCPCFPKPCTWAPPGPWQIDSSAKKDKKDTMSESIKAPSK